MASPRVTPKSAIKEEVELVEITSISLQSENVLAIGTTRKQLATYYFGFTDEEEAMEWMIAMYSLRSTEIFKVFLFAFLIFHYLFL